MRLVSPLVLLLVGCSDYQFNKSTDPKAGPEDTGEPLPAETQVDVWDLADSDGIDLLFFGDTSSSMTAELETMGSLVTDFVTRLGAYTSDWQILVVTGPDGCGINGVLSPEIPDYAARFAEAIVTPPGEDDVDEWGLYNSAQAIELTDGGECNQGFVRADAILHVIFISDEDDNSPGWDTDDPDYWKPYVEAIVAKKGMAPLVRFSAVAGTVPDGCDGAEPGYGYSEAVEATGGEFISICDDWPSQLDLLVDSSVERSIYPLSRVPEPDTIEVRVNGTVRDSGWTWDEVANTVAILDTPPKSGDYVTIGYEVVAD